LEKIPLPYKILQYKLVQDMTKNSTIVAPLDFQLVMIKIPSADKNSTAMLEKIPLAGKNSTGYPPKIPLPPLCISTALCSQAIRVCT
jgi:hypothetical protein